MSINHGKPYNHGKPWSDSEEKMLLQELNSKHNMIQIAQNHQRTTCGIEARIKQIAYKMYLQNIPMEKIEQITKLNSSVIIDCIKSKHSKEKHKCKSITEFEYLKKENEQLKEKILLLEELLNIYRNF